MDFKEIENDRKFNIQNRNNSSKKSLESILEYR